MGHGYRWMLQMTGLPGWMRFGFSPGWGGGLPPMAQYLSQTGQLPQAINWFQQKTPAPTPMQGPMPVPTSTGLQQPISAPIPQMTKEQEIKMLENQASNLESQLDQIKSRIEQLKGE